MIWKTVKSLLLGASFLYSISFYGRLLSMVDFFLWLTSFYGRLLSLVNSFHWSTPWCDGLWLQSIRIPILPLKMKISLQQMPPYGDQYVPVLISSSINPFVIGVLPLTSKVVWCRPEYEKGELNVGRESVKSSGWKTRNDTNKLKTTNNENGGGFIVSL